MTYQELLRELQACDAARVQAGDRDMETVLRTCQRADWLLWLYGRMVGKKGWPTHQQVVLAACACAATAVKFARPEDRAACRRAIAAARRWARGKATLEQLQAAAADTAAARAAAKASAKASDADDAAYAAAAAAASWAAAAWAAAEAAYAAAWAADDGWAAPAKSLRAMCAIVRKYCPMPKNAVLAAEAAAKEK